MKYTKNEKFLKIFSPTHIFLQLCCSLPLSQYAMNHKLRDTELCMNFRAVSPTRYKRFIVPGMVTELIVHAHPGTYLLVA